MLRLASAAPTMSLQNRQATPLLLTFWENGCNVDTPNQSTFVFSKDGPSYSGDCVPAPAYNWQNLEVEQGTDKFTVEFFSGEGCNNSVLVRFAFSAKNSAKTSYRK